MLRGINALPRFFMIVLCLFAAAQASAGRKVLWDPQNTDRPGNDIARLNLQTQDACAFQCTITTGCAAFTFVKPGFQAPGAVCYLKRSVGKLVNNDCCQSGRTTYVPDPVHPPLTPIPTPDNARESTSQTEPAVE